MELAERYRRDGDLRNARELLARAKEHYPEYKPLGELEEEFVGDSVIDWFSIIFPATTTDNNESSES